MISIPSVLFFARRLLLVQLVVVLSSIDFHDGSSHKSLLTSASSDTLLRSSSGYSTGGSGGGGGGGFNYEIEKRVHERVSELMSVPVTMVGLVEQYSKTDVFEPPFLRPHQRDDIFRFLWTVSNEFNIDMYYGQEDGLFLGIIKGSGTYLEGRGSNGYLVGENFDGNNRVISEQDAYMKQLYYNECLDRETGVAQNCLLTLMEDYVACKDNCRPTTPCPSSIPSASTTAMSVVSSETVATTTEQIIYCPSYDVLQVPAVYSMGYVPRYYYCLNNAGTFIENDPPNSVASPSSMNNGVCTHSDGVTLVEGKAATKKTYAMADRRNYLFLHDYGNENGNMTESQANAVLNAATQFLYTDDPSNVDDSQKTDQIFVGGHHSRRYEPRLRPWYIGTREVQNAYWTKPYPFATNNDMGITYAKPLYYTDPSTGHKVFRGVLGVDYDLDEISRFLRDVFLELKLLAPQEDEQPIQEDSTGEDETTKTKTTVKNNDEMYSSSSGATVLIFEDDAPHYIIGSSTGSKAAQKVRIDDESIICSNEDFFSDKIECTTVRSTPKDYAKNSNRLDGVMALAFEAQKKSGFPKELVVSAAPVASSSNTDDDDGISDFYVSASLIYEQSEGENLRWWIIVAMPVGLAPDDDILYGDPMFIVVLVVAVVGCVACLVLFYYYFSKRKRTEVRMSDWRFTSAFILGCALLNLTTITTLGPATDASCMIRMWTFHLVFVLALSPLLVKVWRINRLVGSADRAIRLSITNLNALMYTVPPILLQALILTMFSIYDPTKRYTYVDIDGNSSAEHSICEHNTGAFTTTQIVFEGGLVLIGCILAFKTRNLGSAFGEAKQLLFAMYNVGLVGVIVMLMGYCLHIDQRSIYVIKTLGVFWATVFSSCAFVLPRLLQVQKNQMRRASTRNSFVGQRSGSFQQGSGSFTGSGYLTGNNSKGFSVGGSLLNEPKTSDINGSSLHSGEFNVDLTNRSSHIERACKIMPKANGLYTNTGPSDSDIDDDLHDCDCEESFPEGIEKQEHRTTSFTQLSISASESEVLQELSLEDVVVKSAKSADSVKLSTDDIEANLVFVSENDDGEKKANRNEKETADSNE